MKANEFRELVDDYLFNRLSPEKKEQFEQHYFNCPSSFQYLQERRELIFTVKTYKEQIFQDSPDHQPDTSSSLLDRIFAFLTPRQWAAAAAASAVVIFLALVLIPSLQSPGPEFFLDQDTVRGESITLITDAIPTQFRWEKIGENIQYQISIYNHTLIWQETTRNNFISLPGSVKEKLTPGKNYFWQIKAFSPEGTLLAESSKIQFPVIPEK
ncbi:MAG: zf-HC2 domain-containing protein [Candidatus Aminicenantes bacterium]